MSVTPISKNSNDSFRITVADLLVISQQECDAERFNKAFLILLDQDEEGSYEVCFRNAGMRMSEVLALLEVAKTRVLADMGYLSSE
ncbi:MAG: hypothetical protein V7688_12780 [Alcanivorax jadensis]|uniref:hypothetical protein n=1 Tax=Alcanivorax jadensis TaxID=64988 RepID=UPI003001375E